MVYIVDGKKLTEEEFKKLQEEMEKNPLCYFNWYSCC